jgi:hypothetical protein
MRRAERRKMSLRSLPIELGGRDASSGVSTRLRRLANMYLPHFGDRVVDRTRFVEDNLSKNDFAEEAYA